jgi:hypothetical protein
VAVAIFHRIRFNTPPHKGDEMKTTDLLADGLTRNLGMLKMTLADFSDADMLVRPVLGANHAMWQLGHLIATEARLINMAMPGAVPQVPADFADKFTKQTVANDDPKQFPTKAEALAQLEKVRAATVGWVRGLSDEVMSRPAPEAIQRIAPTVGDLPISIPNHVNMHLGQMQVIRRKLGKPILF